MLEEREKNITEGAEGKWGKWSGGKIKKSWPKCLIII